MSGVAEGLHYNQGISISVYQWKNPKEVNLARATYLLSGIERRRLIPSTEPLPPILSSSWTNKISLVFFEFVG